MKICPIALKILNELNKCEENEIIFNALRNPNKKKEVRKALEELRKLNSDKISNQTKQTVLNTMKE